MDKKAGRSGERQQSKSQGSRMKIGAEKSFSEESTSYESIDERAGPSGEQQQSNSQGSQMNVGAERTLSGESTSYESIYSSSPAGRTSDKGEEIVFEFEHDNRMNSPGLATIRSTGSKRTCDSSSLFDFVTFSSSLPSRSRSASTSYKYKTSLDGHPVLQTLEKLQIPMENTSNERIRVDKFYELVGEDAKLSFVYNACRIEGVNYPSLERVHTKNIEEYKTFMNHGNKLFKEFKEITDSSKELTDLQKKKLFGALDYFTEALAHVPFEGDELSRVFCQRAAVLMKMNDFVGAYIDLRRCTGRCDDAKIAKAVEKLTDQCYVRLMEYKALKRQVEIETEKQGVHPPIDSLTGIRQKINEEEVDTPVNVSPLSALQIRDISYEVGQATVPPNIELSDRLTMTAKDIKFSKKDPRFDVPIAYLSAMAPFKPGDWLMTAKPFVGMLDPKYFRMYCSHCFIHTQSLFPCITCSLVMFCSDGCRQEAYSQYHKGECKYLSHMVAAKRPRDEMLAMRILMKITSQGLQYPRMYRGKVNPFTYAGFKGSSLVKEIDYHAIRKIEIFFDEIDVQLQINRYRQTLYLLQMLKQTNFFNNVSSIPPYESRMQRENLTADESNAALLIAKCWWVARLSAQPIMRTAERVYQNTSVNRHGEIEIGDISHPLLSIHVMKSSCDPNAMIVNFKHGAYLFAIKPIRKHQAITFSFGGSYIDFNKEERVKTLHEKYHMISTIACSCTACIDNWMYEGMHDRFPSYHNPNRMTETDFKNLRAQEKVFRQLWTKSKKIKELTQEEFQMQLIDEQGHILRGRRNAGTRLRLAKWWEKYAVR